MRLLPPKRTLSRLREVVTLSNEQKPTQRVKKNKEVGNYISNKITKSNSRKRP